MDRLPSYQTLRRMAYFVAIAEAGSIRGAARRLRLSVPVVSAALAELEAELGVSLAVRTTRSFRLTDAGERVHEKALGIVRLMGEAQAIGAPDRPLNGHLSLSLAVELATYWVPPILAVFRGQHPGVTLTVDSNDGVVNLGDSAFDLAIRTRMVHGAEGLKLACVAHEDIARRVVEGRVPAPLIGGGGGANGQVRARDRTSGDMQRLDFDGIITVSNKSTTREMVRAGMGAALLIDLGLDDGLIPVDDDLDFGCVALDIVLRDPLPSAEVTAFLAMDGIAGLPVTHRREAGR